MVPRSSDTLVLVMAEICYVLEIISSLSQVCNCSCQRWHIICGSEDLNPRSTLKVPVYTEKELLVLMEGCEDVGSNHLLQIIRVPVSHWFFSFAVHPLTGEGRSRASSLVQLHTWSPSTTSLRLHSFVLPRAHPGGPPSPSRGLGLCNLLDGFLI